MSGMVQRECECRESLSPASGHGQRKCAAYERSGFPACLKHPRPHLIYSSSLRSGKPVQEVCVQSEAQFLKVRSRSGIAALSTRIKLFCVQEIRIHECGKNESRPKRQRQFRLKPLRRRGSIQILELLRQTASSCI